MLGLQFWPSRLPAELLDVQYLALSYSSERRLISPLERAYPYRNSSLQEHALLSMIRLGRLSSSWARRYKRALLCSVRAPLPMPGTPARTLLPASFTTSGSPPVCVQAVAMAVVFATLEAHVAQWRFFVALFWPLALFARAPPCCSVHF